MTLFDSNPPFRGSEPAWPSPFTASGSPAPVQTPSANARKSSVATWGRTPRRRRRALSAIGSIVVVGALASLKFGLGYGVRRMIDGESYRTNDAAVAVDTITTVQVRTEIRTSTDPLARVVDASYDFDRRIGRLVVEHPDFGAPAGDPYEFVIAPSGAFARTLGPSGAPAQWFEVAIAPFTRQGVFTLNKPADADEHIKVRGHDMIAGRSCAHIVSKAPLAEILKHDFEVIDAAARVNASGLAGTSVSIDIWIDDDDHLCRMAYSHDVGVAFPELGQISVSTTYSNFGDPVDVSFPLPADVAPLPVMQESAAPAEPAPAEVGPAEVAPPEVAPAG